MAGANQCYSDDECQGDRICSGGGWCSGDSNCDSPAENDGACADDDTWLDNGGDGCGWYDDNAGSCGDYGDGAWSACCACGGGGNSVTLECTDDYSWTDTGGDGCGWYDTNAESCGAYGEGAFEACCACGQGSTGNFTSSDECMDDWEWYDNDGDDCDYYYANPEQCGNYGEGAWDACCACGGSGSDDMDWDRDDEWDGCESDFSWVDDGGDNCDWYESNDQSCGSYGEGAWEACCACGGGNWGWEDDWSDDDGEPIDWEWYVDEA